MHVYSEDCLMELGNIIGTAMKVDINTLAQGNNRNMQVERGKYARVSVEVDLNKQLKSRFVIRKKIFKVEYEGLEDICFKCGKYGHKVEVCSLSESQEKEQSGENVEPSSAGKEKVRGDNQKEEQYLFSVPGMLAEEEFGDWMKAKNTFKPKGRRSESAQKIPVRNPAGGRTREKDVKVGGGSRFKVLQEQEEYIKCNGQDMGIRTKAVTKEWKRKGEKKAMEEEQSFRSDVMQEVGKINYVAGESSRSRGELGDKTFSADKLVQVMCPLEKEKRKEAIESKNNKGNGSEGLLGRNMSPIGKDRNKRMNHAGKEVNGLKISGGVKKRGSSTRPINVSQELRRKSALRAHNVVFGNLIQKGPMGLSGEGEVYDIKIIEGAGENKTCMQGNYGMDSAAPGESQTEQQINSSASGELRNNQQNEPPDILASEMVFIDNLESPRTDGNKQSQHGGEREGMEVIPSSLE